MIGVRPVFELTLSEIKVGFKKAEGNRRRIAVKGSSNHLCMP